MITKADNLQLNIFLKMVIKHLDLSVLLRKQEGLFPNASQGFSDTLLAHQITLFDKHVYDLEHMDPQDIIDSISHDSCPPTGLFVFSDETALQLINIASNKGWDILPACRL